MADVRRAQYVIRKPDGGFDVFGWDKDFVQIREGERLNLLDYRVLRNDITG